MINPLDKSTIISIVPFDIIEHKPTIFPGKFVIPPAKDDDFELLTIGPSFWFQDMGEDRPPIRIPESSLMVADSLVNDFCNGQLGCDMVEAVPGISFIPGVISKKDVKDKIEYQTLLLEMDRKQRNWFMNLVKIADALWVRTGGQPAAISTTARIAAQKLNLTNKEWLKDFQTIDLVRCPACGTLKDPQFPVCTSCHTIVDAAKYNELKLVSLDEKVRSNTLTTLIGDK